MVIVKEAMAYADDDALQIDVGRAFVLEHATHEHEGLRIKLTARLHKTEMPTYIDIGIGGMAPAHVREIRPLPMIPGETVSTIRCQTWEHVVADKLHAIVKHGMQNTRMKDLKDLLVLADRDLDVDGIEAAVQHTFRDKRTRIPHELPVGLTEAFAAAHQQDWIRYLDDNSVPDMPHHLQDALDEIVDIYGDALVGSLQQDNVSYMRR